MKTFKEFLNEALNSVFDLSKGEGPNSGVLLGSKVKTELGVGTVDDVIGPQNSDDRKLKVKLDSGKMVTVDTKGKEVKRR